jgi:ubiquinone/menaquinone biosynthesis C-methylase UbiE
MNHDQQSKKHWEESYQNTGDSKLWPEVPVPFLSRAITSYGFEPKSLIDIPCGDGKNSSALAIGCRHLVCADASRTALAKAKAKLDEERLDRCLFMEVDATLTPFCDDQFDGVFCCDLLSHLRDPLVALREMIRIVRPGCCVVANVFSLADSTRQSSIQHLHQEDYLYLDRFFFRYYSHDTVLQLLSQCEAEVTWLDEFNWQEPPHPKYREHWHSHSSFVFCVSKK